jgi:hypothetical protein
VAILRLVPTPTIIRALCLYSCHPRPANGNPSTLAIEHWKRLMVASRRRGGG